ncbi:MAG: hypothetical protein NT150_03490 [Bacteroidetes bacterium]|nr:hypothetical protein [Bacteroidota bacterium]
MEKINVEWFEKEIAPSLKCYKISYRFYEEGDLGSLHQVEFNSSEKGGNIDFWGLGWLGVFVWDYKKEEQILNILIDPENQSEKEKVFQSLKNILQ